MGRPVWRFSLLFLFVVGYRAGADTYSAYPDHREVDPSGKYYVVIRRNGGPRFDDKIVRACTMTIVECARSSPPIYAAATYPRFEDGSYVIDRNKDVEVRAGDTVRGTCKLDAAPFQVDISSSGLGIVAVDVWPYNMSDFNGISKNSVIFLTMDGQIKFRKDLLELFGRDKSLFSRTESRVEWLSRAWIDEGRREFVIVSTEIIGGGATRQRLLRAIDLGSGKIRVADASDVMRAIPDALIVGDYGKLNDVLHLIEGMNLRQAKPFLIKVYANDKVPLFSRLRAGVVLSRFGDNRARDLFANTAVDQGNDLQEYATELLPDMLGRDALAALLTVIQQKGNRIDSSVGSALKKLGPEAVPLLVRMLNDVRNPSGQFDAIEVLAMMGPDSKAAVPSLVQALRWKTQVKVGMFVMRIDKTAAWAIGQIGPAAADALPGLSALDNDTDESVRQTAREATNLIRGRAAPDTKGENNTGPVRKLQGKP